MDSAMTHLVWQPLKSTGRWLQVLDRRSAVLAYVTLLALSIYAVYGVHLSHTMLDGLIWISAILSILLFVRAYANTGTALMCWTQIFLGQVFAGVFLSALAGAGQQTILIYLTGIVVAYLAGVLCLWLLDRTVRLTVMEYHGYMYEHPTLGNVFFIACLALMVFPITPSFIGEETFLSLIKTDHGALVAIFALGYMLSGVCAMRLFTKIFFGPHKKSYHEIAYRSS